jgi:predicted DNA binding protein
VAFDELTEKQTDVLRTASLAGTIERPPQASAADFAETLGVSPSTFLSQPQHRTDGVP